jgi:hypothetical protein
MPIFWWNKIHETGNLGYLIKGIEGNVPAPRGFKYIAFTLLFRKLQDEFIIRFGLSDEYVNILNKELQIFKLRAERLASGDKSTGIFISVAEFELEAMNKNMKGGQEFNILKAYMERALSFTINPKVISVAEFYSYLSILKKDAQTAKSRG